MSLTGSISKVNRNEELVVSSKYL